MSKKFNFNNFKPTEFQDHINRSVPNIKGMYDIIPIIVENFSVKGTNVYDIGCSTGYLLNEIATYNSTSELSYIGYDISDNLFFGFCNDALQLYKRDVTEDSLTMFNTSLVLSVFTLQFIDLDKRVRLVQKVYDSLSKRGCFLVCEKVTSTNGFVEDIFTFSNYQKKIENGFTPEEILKKQKDLKSIMHPISQKENEKMFREAGFEVVEVFFKSLNFIGWILIK
tara:strand:+ start:7732 stop:8403 length:672 start_codon:yes stop_codon:yes gene_type:complete